MRSIETWERNRAYFAKTHGEPYDDAQKISPVRHFENLLIAASSCDALVLTGDIVDYMSDENIDYVAKGLKAIGKPILSVCGNHENRSMLPEDFPGGAAKSVCTLDLGDLLIVGLDDSGRRITRDQLDELARLFSTRKPVLLAMHVPFDVPANDDVLRTLEPYYILNADGCPKENLEFIDMVMSESSPVRAILSGHIHFSCVRELRPGLTMYGVSQGVAGNINEYTAGDIT